MDQLNRVEKFLTANQEAFCTALKKDFNKPLFEQLFEITVPLGVVKYYKENLKHLMTPERIEIPKGLEATGNKGMIYKEPYGVTLVIGPFNAPVLLLLAPAITALASGNNVILYPADTTPTVAALFAELVPKYFEPEAVNVVIGAKEEITELLKLPFDYIFFTGSSTVGKVVMRAAAENLTPIVLVLGGQNPTVEDETANIDIAVDRIAWGHMAIYGQWCIAPGQYFGRMGIFIFGSSGESTENPFEGGANDVPITQISRTIEIDLREILGETSLPPAIGAQNNIIL